MSYKAQRKEDSDFEMPVGIEKNPYEREINDVIIPTGGYRHSFGGCTSCLGSFQSSALPVLGIGAALLLAYYCFK